MDAPLYDVYLTGKLADDVSPALAAQRLAALFKSTPEAMAALITGKAQLLKRGVDKNTALKYREALQRAGCDVAFKAQVTVLDEKPVNAAPAQTNASSATASASASLQLAPAGGELLRPEEHRTVAAVAVDTSHLSLAPVGPLPTLAPAAAVQPDLSHLSLAPAGGLLLSEAEREKPPISAPDIGDLSVAEVGAPIDTLKSERAPVNPDISGLQLAPAGADLLRPEERARPPIAPPATDHITLAP